ncbi:MAG: YihY/virulence factor BrkB family protein, partial [Actinomyces sp.]
MGVARSGVTFVVTVARRVTDHHTMLVASGVAFSCLIGLVPALLAVVAVYGLVASPADVEANLAPLVDALPPEAGQLIVDQLRKLTAVDRTQVTAGLVIGLVGAAWAVSNALNSIVMAIRIAHEIPSPHTWVRGRIFALRLSLIAILATASMIWLVVVLPEVLDRVDAGDELRHLLSIGRWVVVFVLSTLALGVLYKTVLSHDGARRRTVSTGAVVGTSLWVVSTWGLDVVYGRLDSLHSSFGPLAAVFALMAWLYLSALSALLGAEIDGALHHFTYPAGVDEAPVDLD